MAEPIQEPVIWKPVFIVTPEYESRSEAWGELMRRVEGALLMAEGAMVFVRRAPQIQSHHQFDSEKTTYRGTARLTVAPRERGIYEDMIGVVNG